MKKVITIITIILLAFLFTMPSFAYKYHNFDLSYNYFSSTEKALAESDGIEATTLYKIGYQDGYHYSYEHYQDNDYNNFSYDDYGRSYDEASRYFDEGTFIENTSTCLQLSMLYYDGYTDGGIAAEKELGIVKTYDDGWDDGYEQAKEEYSVPDEDETEKSASSDGNSPLYLIALIVVVAIIAIFIGVNIFAPLHESIKNKKENKKKK